ncbi:protein transport protein Sec61 subunit beta [Sesamum angolense]|uniref:Protein transport protein Sec61 subunit beta n=1 Tax=Sesamum angolense TaxID=2727404 RepID=A0AAE1WPV7_9LAMI|nr:protein transport protein Sec61 subunit beta [Sesamum angolense]
MNDCLHLDATPGVEGFMHLSFHLCSFSHSVLSFYFYLLSMVEVSYRAFINREILAAEMATGGAAPQRGTAAAAAANLRRRRTAGAAGGASGTMLQFYTDDAPGLKISPNVVLVMSIGFIAFVAILHVMGKLYFVRKE